ncbi:MAG TPA: SRPBCC family protein [Mycobacteriales bacterium]
MTAHAESTANGWVLVLERQLRHPPAAVWAALTEPGQLGQWAPFTTERSLAEPGDLTLTMIDDDSRTDLPATVTKADPPTLLEYTWGDDLLRWELAPIPGGTRLTLRHRVGDQGDLARAAAGWHLCLDVAEHLLDGDPVPPIRGREAMDHGWQALHDRYVVELGASG